MRARLTLALAAAAAACSAPPGPGADPAPAAGGWLALADQAEARGDPETALRCLERDAAEEPEAAGEEALLRRLRLAGEIGDAESELLALHALLAREPEDLELRFRTAEALAEQGGELGAAQLLDREYADPVARLRAARRIAEYLERAGAWVEAAERLERAAADPAAGDAARGWWERASWLWERAGEPGRATRAIERALEGAALGPREEAALARLRAFELGAIETVADATAALRFHPDAELRLRAARFLAAREFPDDVAAFARARSDPDGRIVAAALQELAARAGPSERAFAASCARPLLDDPRAGVASAALELLGRTGAAADAPLLIAALDPADRERFRAARRALETLTGRVEPAPLDPDEAGRAALREAWLQWWRARSAPG